MKLRIMRFLPALMLLAAFAAASVWQAAWARELNPPGIADGPGIWANVWNYPAGDLDAYCNNLRAYGVRNLFIQTTRSNMPAVAHPEELASLIDACHRHRIRVIGWAYLDLSQPEADADKMLAAARFQSPHGGRLDAIAPDLEKNLTPKRVEQFSSKLREALGASYPLIAVVYSPLNHYREVADIPWKTLAKYYDVVAPMSYWNSKYQKLDAYDYTIATVRTVRELTGRPDIEIHVIGDGMGTSSAGIVDFMRACKRCEATSASIYPNQRPTQDQLAALSRYSNYFQPNSRFRLAAFRQMLRSQSITATQAADPTQPVTRGQFYLMASHYLHAPLPAPDVLAGADAPIYADEALSLLAHLVDAQPPSHAKIKRADRWFAPPAMAEAAPRRHSESDRPLNLLDASQMILEASSALR